MKKKKPKKFKCQACKGIFEEGWTEEEALEEWNRDFPNVPFDESAVICDDCYKLMTKYFEEHPERKPPLP
jgi:hypothetical protein